MFNMETFAELIINTVPRARYASGKKELLMRCPLCGDSENPKSAHFYISLDDTKPIFYYCQKCKGTGIVTHSTLMEWGIYDPNINVDIIEYNKKKLNDSKNFKFIDKEIYKLNNEFVTINEASDKKLAYINERLGTNLSYQEILDKKIVLNIGDLLDSNKIYRYTRDLSIMQQLNNHFIGFISHDNAFLNMRNLSEGSVYKSIDKRYVNYNIFGKFNNAQRFYTIPTQVDLNNPKRIKLNISEGAFDILSVYYNLRHQEKHSIYASVGGSGYLNLIKNFILNMKLVYIEVHVYIDSDIKTSVVYEMKRYLSIYNIPLYIHRNLKSGEKDFGVPIERIIEGVDRLC